ncbi:hypothetical protein BJ138DRAFT_1116728 [Hygrophoropsis aurantiaca]|uniref:Uncharacterized protein n=1 Tax=Hygrophoropsis aurantiaca TaxID=72124 RepID=A0ACB8A2Z1_9AGAM|nr:hypothetical protein BJ138DRAFT_1116728 [Hygrophoropsis aurantiaca]
MFSRTIALVSMFALAATASPSLVARGGGGGGGGSCNASGGYAQNCCQSSQLAGSALAALLGIPLNALVGLDCVVSNTCSQTAICCTNSQETWGLINVNVQCVSL